MLKYLLPAVLGNKNEREVSRIRKVVDRIKAHEQDLQRERPERLVELTAGWRKHLSRYHPLDAPGRGVLERMSEAELQATAERIGGAITELRGEFSGLPASVEASAESISAAAEAFQGIEERLAAARAKYLEKILPEAYAVVKNAARRLCGSEVMVSGQALKWQMIHFDVQLIGGVALHRGMIAEMQTGEGKTLVATLPVYLNALAGLGVHVVTVNDYLARRDSEWMGALFGSLGLTVGCIRNQMPPHERKAEYECDITYGTSSEFGFDYLRDNGMALSREEQSQRGHYFALIDEVDSILIDDARTPLIITGPSSRNDQQFDAIKPEVERLVKLQTELCNRLAADAKAALAEGDAAKAGKLLLKLKLGQPRNRQMLRFMEDPEIRRLLEKAELRHTQGPFKMDVYTLKEDLYFSVDAKRHDADLLEKGRKQLAPEDPESFTMPDIGPQLAALRDDATLDAAAKALRRREIEARAHAQAGKIHAITQLLKAYCLYEKNVHYVVKEGKVTIIDESTGREMPGRRWSDGLHQAVEAKERVKIEKETRTYASITIQNYFRLYEKLAGMTGTAETEVAEFHDIYQLDVLPIPTNTACIRVDDKDRIFKTRRDKFAAVISRIEQAHAEGQPVLVGTASVETSETMSRMLKRSQIPHTVLNAKLHEQEAAIVARAGERGAVTVSTNMAGRGTDIALGNGVAELGGLFVIGTERHASRRVDRQLRGRCSRQGDPGRSQFFVSLEDDLMRNHASPDHMAAIVEQSDSNSGRILGGISLGGMVEGAQKRVEQRDYQSRKQILEYDDVMNLQRGIVYGFRNEVLAADDPRGLVANLIREILVAGFAAHPREGGAENPDFSALIEWLGTLGVKASNEELMRGDAVEVMHRIEVEIAENYRSKLTEVPGEVVEQQERMAILSAIDQHWQEHLEQMEELRDGIFLRAQGQKDPLVEYKNEAYSLFAVLMDEIREDALRKLLQGAARLEAFALRLKKQARG